MRVLFDTSVIVASLLRQHPKHDECLATLTRAKSGQTEGYISTHSLAETYSVLTRMPIQPKVSLTSAEQVILTLVQYVEVVTLTMSDYQAAIAQLVSLNIPGGAVFDALIAQAAMKVEAEQLFTLNPKHFVRLEGTIAKITTVPE